MSSGSPFPADGRFTAAVRDPIWKHIYLTPELFDISKSLPFTRLSRIRQLGPVDILYPGATHTRAAHSYGVYHLTRLLLARLADRGASEWITGRGVFSCLAAALLHDAGHFPFTHSLKELPLREHESLTADIILSPAVAPLVERAGADPEQTAAIVDTERPSDDVETLFYRSLLSGVLDPDKLDYLNRDAFFCGVPYGIQDTDYLLARLKPDPVRGVTLDAQSIMQVESLLFAKYEMYRSVYWHETVRVATAMMKKALYGALSRGVIVPEELYNQDDEGIYRLIRARDFGARKAAENLYERKLYSVCFRLAFDESKQAHRRLEDLLFRSREEAELAELFSAARGSTVSPDDVIIDIPERISFESGLWISGDECPFSQSTTVFTPETVRQFTRSLRILRVAVSPDIHLTGDERNKLAEICNLRYTD